MSMLHEPQTSLNRLEGDNTGALGLLQAPLFPRYLGEISPLFRRYRHSLFGARPSAIFGWPWRGPVLTVRGPLSLDLAHYTGLARHPLSEDTDAAP